MADRMVLEFVCHICNEPINLETDLATDENGRSLHGDCYSKQIKAQETEGRVPASVHAVD
jgi:hypothetical protein